jgi:protein-disulfide isomerase
MRKPLFPLLGVALVGLFVLNAAASPVLPDQQTSAKKSATAKTPRFPIPAERASGRKDAPIVIEVFSDFECPFCRDWYATTLTRVIDDYCSKGKVYLVHHEFPLKQHRYSRDAARWALACAGIGAYELAAAALFRDQEIWGRSGNIEATMASVLTAQELKKVKQAMVDSKEQIESVLESDIFMGNTFRVDGTPAFRILVHGTLVYAGHGEQGTTPPRYSILKRYLDEQLAK